MVRHYGIRIDRAWYKPELRGQVVNTGRTFLMANLGNELSCRSFWMDDYYEPLSMLALDSLGDRVSTFIDVGSNVGVFALFAASRPVKPPKVFAFEPNPQMRAILETNCRINQLPVQVSAVALSDKVGSAQFYQPESDTSGCLDEDFNPDVVDSFTVQTETLDQHFGQSSDFAPEGTVIVKMDVLGHESAVLRGGHEFTRKYLPVFLLEAVRDYDPVEIEFLNECGYRFYLILPGKLEEITEIKGREQEGFFFANFIATADPAIASTVSEALGNRIRAIDFSETSLEGFDGHR